MKILLNRLQMKNVVFILLLSLVFNLSYAQVSNYEWALNIGGGRMDVGNDVAVDSKGNVYIIGTFKKKADFNPDPKDKNILKAKSNSVFVAKYDQHGNYIWAFSVGGKGHDEGLCITTDHEDNVIIGGLFMKTANFESSLRKEATLKSTGFRNSFIAKYDSDGNYLWAIGFGGKNNYEDRTSHLSTDSKGNIYAAGIFSGTTDFDPGDNIAEIETRDQGGFLAKYDKDGNYQWAIHSNSIYLMIGGDPIGPASPSAHKFKFAIHNDKYIYLTGGFSGTFDFDPSANKAELTASAVSSPFIAKYDVDGNYLWAYQLETDHEDEFNRALAMDIDKEGNIYIGGRFKKTLYPDPEKSQKLEAMGKRYHDIFIAKYTSDGEHLWSFNRGDAKIDLASLMVDNQNNIHLIGTFNEEVDFDPSSKEFKLEATKLTDIYVASYDSEGKFINAFSQGGKTYMDGYGGYIHDGYLYLTGRFGKLNPTPSGEELKSNKGYDVLLAKYKL